MITRRQFTTAAAGTGAATVLAACSKSDDNNKPAERTSPLPEGYPDLKWQGTITMGAQAYTPSLPGVKLAPGTPKLEAFGKIAKEFETLYPGIKFKFLGSEYQYDPSLMKTQASGGQLPDIWWQQWQTVNASFPKGVARNLHEDMQKPNPFVKDNAKWQDLYSEQIYTMCMADANTQYVNNGDFVGTAFFYNIEIFEKHGISTEPKTYDDLLQICQKLQDAGVTPSALPVYTTGYSWFSRLFLANFLGLENLKKIDGYSEAKGIGATDIAIAWNKGIIDPRKNPAVLAWWPHAKKLYSFFDKSVTRLPKTPPAGSPDYERLLAAGKVGMVYDGTWLPTVIKAATDDKMKVGSFNFPNLQGTDSYATDYDSANSVGGPNAAWQYFMSSPQANQSLKDKAKEEAVLAWMQFFTTPERNSEICNERASFVPTLKGATPLESLKPIVEQLDKPLYAVQGGWEFSVETADGLDALFQQFVLDQVSMDQVATKYVEIVQKGFDSYVKAHPIDFSKYE